MDGAAKVGRVRIKQGRAIVVPADTVLILPEDSRIRSVELHYMQQAPGSIKHIKAPIDDRK